MFTKTIEYYDLVYAFKHYDEEANKIRALIRQEHPTASTVLDVACGTGEHAKFLADDFHVDGLDLESGFVEMAQRKVPSGRFVVADMRTFDLGRHYDVVQCLFSSIGYLKHGYEVIQAFQCFRQHLAEGGVILVEPWFTPETWKVGEPFMAPPVDRPDLKICRMNVSGREGNLAQIRFHYLIATRDGVEYLQEDHELALYTVQEMLEFFDCAGLQVKYEPEGLFGRGLYIARPQGTA